MTSVEGVLGMCPCQGARGIGWPPAHGRLGKSEAVPNPVLHRHISRAVAESQAVATARLPSMWSGLSGTPHLPTQPLSGRACRESLDRSGANDCHPRLHTSHANSAAPWPRTTPNSFSDLGIDDPVPKFRIGQCTAVHRLRRVCSCFCFWWGTSLLLSPPSNPNEPNHDTAPDNPAISESNPNHPSPSQHTPRTPSHHLPSASHRRGYARYKTSPWPKTRCNSKTVGFSLPGWAQTHDNLALTR